jgi:SAM-dependent methyltransferase
MDIEKKVKELYTKYTYPKYDKYMDKYAPIPHQYSPHLFPEQINHYIYGDQQKNYDGYRVLIAGVGIGSDLINTVFFLKKYNNIHIHCVDLSPTVIEICKYRLGLYKFDNLQNVFITFEEKSLLDLKPGNVLIQTTYDMIICHGVLHHLEDPPQGLNVLNSVLKSDGFISIMVYGKIGRTAIYQMQELVKLMSLLQEGKKEQTLDDKIKLFRTIHKSLPQSNWFEMSEKILGQDILTDEGIVDLILHYQDRAYNIPELYDWVNKSNMDIVEFSPETRYKLNYNIQGILSIIPKNQTTIIKKQQINELYFGNIKKHCFLCHKTKSKSKTKPKSNYNIK